MSERARTHARTRTRAHACTQACTHARPEEGKTNSSRIAERVDVRRMIAAVHRLSDDALNEELRRRGLL